MKIENNCIIYNDNESNFIAALSTEAQKNIFRGIAIPSDYGYNPKSVYFKIDGQSIEGIPTEREQFIEFFNELETLMYSDDRKYWVLYDEVNPETPFHKEIFWCIPTSEIEFIYIDGEWHHLRDEVTDAVEKIMTGVTLDEEEEVTEWEFVSLEDAYEEELLLFDEFEERFTHYLLYDNRADETTFKLWKTFKKDIEATSADIMTDNKVCLITWLKNNWGAWLECVLDDTFKYMNVSELVLDSWNKFCE